MNPELVVLVLVVVTALTFDFTNGFHDTANAMASSIATKALSPKAAVTLSAVLNLIGAFLSVEVALTVTNAVIKIQNADGTPKSDLMDNGGHELLMIVLAGLVGAIIWNLLTWLFSLPSSSSHALFGGLIGSTIAGLGWDGVKWIGTGAKLDGVVGKVILPALMSPLIAGIVASVGTALVVRIAKTINEQYAHKGFRWGQILSASMVSLSHGTNDAQKTMGVITLALIASGYWTDTHSVPFEVKIACALAIALGTYIGGWRIIRTMGKGLVAISPEQGISADMSTAATILTSSQLGFALSTTHVATGSIIGSGLGKREPVRWRVAGRMALAWLITIPSAAIVGAALWYAGHLMGGILGAVVVFVILLAASGWMYLHSRKAPVHHENVNEEWQAEIKREKVNI